MVRGRALDRRGGCQRARGACADARGTAQSHPARFDDAGNGWVSGRRCPARKSRMARYTRYSGNLPRPRCDRARSTEFRRAVHSDQGVIQARRSGGAHPAPGRRRQGWRNGSSIVIKILYVEDNDDNVYMLKMRLELLDGFEVVVAEDGEKGCAAAVTEKPDLILMDLDLPVIDGWEATRRLKSNPETRDVPVIALSAHALAGSREKALAAGCDDFDTKPVEFDRLLGKMRQLLRS